MSHQPYGHDVQFNPNCLYPPPETVPLRQIIRCRVNRERHEQHSVAGQKEREFRAFIKQHPNIIYDNEVLGGDDIKADVQVRSLQDLRALIAEIKRQFSGIIRNYKHMLYYKEHKYLFFPL